MCVYVCQGQYSEKALLGVPNLIHTHLVSKCGAPHACRTARANAILPRQETLREGRVRNHRHIVFHASIVNAIALRRAVQERVLAREFGSSRDAVNGRIRE